MSIPLFISERPKPETTTRPLSVGCLVFERMDQIDFTGPFEVLSRMPDTTVQIIGKSAEPVRDMQGLRLSPDVPIAEAGIFDVLKHFRKWCRPKRQALSGFFLKKNPPAGNSKVHSISKNALVVPGGHGQRALMHDEEILEPIRRHMQEEKLLFSVCTGALLCGAAGILAGRQVTTHWSARHLMPYYGAELVEARVVVDGNIVSAAGVTAGLDAALALVSLLRGDAAAQEIQLAIEYAPDPVFHSGSPETAPAEVLEKFKKKYEPIGGKEKQRRFSMRRGINIIRLRDEFPAKESHMIRLADAIRAFVRS